jgi:LacI family transcriptional regulator
MQQETKPTAIVCTNDTLACGAIFECHAMGLAVPEQLSITGFGDDELASQIEPTLTTISVPCELLGSLAADYLLARSNGERSLDKRDLPLQFIIRESSGPAPLG